MFGVEPYTVRSRIDPGPLPAYRVDGVIVLRLEDSEGFMRRTRSS
jgi:hypothetical protein